MPLCLIVEDSQVIRSVTGSLVERLGLDAAQAETSEEAVEVLQKQKPDVLLVDWDLPSLGALDVLKAVGEIVLEERPYCILTATENEPQHFALARTAGAQAHILKPYDLGSLKEVLEEGGVLPNEEEQAQSA